MTSPLRQTLTSPHTSLRDRSLAGLVEGFSIPQLLAACADLEDFRQETGNLYQRVRALAFLASLQGDHLLVSIEQGAAPGTLCAAGHEHLLARRFEPAIAAFAAEQAASGPHEANCSALAAAYRGLLFATLAAQVRTSVRDHEGNRWIFSTERVADHPLRLVAALADAPGAVLEESTPVRMDLSHSAWSDIFFLAMDDPAGARVLNVSIDLAVRGRDGAPRPPVSASLTLIDEPVLRLHSVDLGARVELTRLEHVFDFGADHLGLLRAGVVASGLVPPGLQGLRGPLEPLLAQVLGPGRGLLLRTEVRGIPKGSRLAVSTSLLASIVALIMRATGQGPELTGGLDPQSARLICARAILGEWLGGSGGGWQDSGGLWPGLKRIRGVAARPGDPEYGVSNGRLLPEHDLLDERCAPALTMLTKGLVLIHGGLAQDVGPVLQSVTERYLLRCQPEWDARARARVLFDEMEAALCSGDLAALGAATHKNFHDPICTIVPWATNAFTRDLIDAVSQRFGAGFLGFWMLGGMAGGGMGLLFDPAVRDEALPVVAQLLAAGKARHEHGLPFAMDPVVYDFSVNAVGSWARLHQGPQPVSARSLPAPAARAAPQQELAELLGSHGFDAARHERLRQNLLAGRVGLARNRLPRLTRVEDARPDDVTDLRGAPSAEREHVGQQALARGELACITLAGGAGTRWTRGAGVVKALCPFVQLGGRHRSFLEVHLAKLAQSAARTGAAIPHVLTTSHLTHQAVAEWAARLDSSAPTLSPGARIGLRLVPTVADLRFAWQQSARALAEPEAQHVAESTEAALMAWAQGVGEGSDYTDNLPSQCCHPPGHASELPNLLLNGTLARLLAERPQLRTLLVHNVDTVGAHPDPAVLGAHLERGAAFSFEVMPRRVDDRGGGLARLDGRLQLVEAVALPREQDELLLSLYNSATTWVDIDGLLELLGLSRAELDDGTKVRAAVEAFLERLPVYITLKDVKKRWGHGQEDVFPVLQAEQLWGDVSALPGVDAQYLLVPTRRGRQLKEPAQLDAWLRDGSAAQLAGLCGW